jgi:hypothetical protein
VSLGQGGKEVADVSDLVIAGLSFSVGNLVFNDGTGGGRIPAGEIEGERLAIVDAKVRGILVDRCIHLLDALGQQAGYAGDVAGTQGFAKEYGFFAGFEWIQKGFQREFVFNGTLVAELRDAVGGVDPLLWGGAVIGEGGKPAFGWGVVFIFLPIGANFGGDGVYICALPGMSGQWTELGGLEGGLQGGIGGEIHRHEFAVSFEVAPKTDGAGQALVMFKAQEQGLDGGGALLAERDNDGILAEVDAAGLAELTGGNILEIADEAGNAPGLAGVFIRSGEDRDGRRLAGAALFVGDKCGKRGEEIEKRNFLG